MKNFSLFFALFCALFFAVSCDSGLKFENPYDIHSPAYHGDDNENGDDEDEGDEEEPLTRTETCSSKPDNTVLNTVDTITQTYYTETGWQPSATPVYNPDPSENECRFKCNEGYEWNGNQCVITGEEGCIAAGGTWDSDTCTRTAACSSKPENTVWNTVDMIAQTYTETGWQPSTTSVYDPDPSESECRFKCNEGSEWNGNSCINNSLPALPECSKSSGTPCHDSSSGLTWSEKASDINWISAKSHCTNLNSSNYGGFTDWRMPNIDELKTLITVPSGTPRTKNCAVSETNNCLSYSNCWTCSTCTEGGTLTDNGCAFGSSYSDGRFSKLGDGNYRLWSSSIQSDQSNYVWGVDFGFGYLKNLDPNSVDLIYNVINVRCVR